MANDETMEVRVRILEDHEKTKKSSCDEFHKCMYEFRNNAQPQVDSWVGFKRWLAGAAVVIFLMVLGIYGAAIEMRASIRTQEQRWERLEQRGVLLGTPQTSAPESGNAPTVPPGYDIVPERRTP